MHGCAKFSLRNLPPSPIRVRCTRPALPPFTQELGPFGSTAELGLQLR